MTITAPREKIQEEEYGFPYHHLVTIRPFSETKHLFWGFRYAGYIEKILETLERYPFDSIIDIGCGDGKVTYELDKKFPNKKIIGVDYSEKSLVLARVFSPHINFQRSSPEQYDVFTLIEVLEHVNPEEMEEFLKSINANLKPNGIGIITTPSDNIPLNSKHYQHFNKISVEKTLGQIFKIESIEYISANTLGVKIIQHILANRFFLLNFSPLITFLYKIYVQKYVQANQKTCSQLFVVVRKK